MGSPLGPTLAHLFMGHQEKSSLTEFNICNVDMYQRCEDDIFYVLGSHGDASIFLGYLNKQHPTIKFTCECEVECKLPFLSSFLDNSGYNVQTRCTESILNHLYWPIKS